MPIIAYAKFKTEESVSLFDKGNKYPLNLKQNCTRNYPVGRDDI